MIEASILLLTKNDRHNVERLLHALFDQEGISSCEVIAIDSGSNDGTLEVLQRFPVRIEQIPPETFHHARTRNFAASLAHGRILVFLSQDAIPASYLWLNSMLANFDDGQVGAVYGRQIPRPDSSPERRDVLDTIYGAEKIVKDPACRNGMGYRFYHFSDVNAAIRRDVWEKAQFPEDLRVFEDLGIAKLILDGGWKIVYEPKAAVVHSHTHTTVGLFKRYFDIGCTLQVLQIWNAPGIRGSLLRDGWKLLKGKIARVHNHHSRRWNGQSLGQDIAKSIGLFLGLNQELLPLMLKRRLSAFGLFE
jgi:Glycosyltransferases involved in cell wall biogenesis